MLNDELSKVKELDKMTDFSLELPLISKKVIFPSPY